MNCKFLLTRTDQQANHLSTRQTSKPSVSAEIGRYSERGYAAYGPNDDTILSCRLAMVQICQMMPVVKTGTQCGTRALRSREGGGSEPICIPW